MILKTKNLKEELWLNHTMIFIKKLNKFYGEIFGNMIEEFQTNLEKKGLFLRDFGDLLLNSIKIGPYLA